MMVFVNYIEPLTTLHTGTVETWMFLTYAILVARAHTHTHILPHYFLLLPTHSVFIS